MRLVPVVLLALSAISAFAADFTLARDGKPAATVVLAATATDKAKVAAADLVATIEKMSGAKLPLVTDTEKP
jgi:hypothetical protein